MLIMFVFKSSPESMFIEPVTFWCLGPCSNELSHLAQAAVFLISLPTGHEVEYVDLSCISLTTNDVDYLFFFNPHLSVCLLRRGEGEREEERDTSV